MWRSRKNKIKRLKASNGQWCDDPSEMAEMACQFFKDLYTKHEFVLPDELVSLFSEKVSAEMNAQL